MRKRLALLLLLVGVVGFVYGGIAGETYLAALATIPGVLGLAWLGEPMR